MEPSQTIPKVTWLSFGLPLVNDLPTASHEVGPRHDTSFSSSPRVPAVTGLGTIDQVEPFHCSISDVFGPAVSVNPAATQKVTLGQDTPSMYAASSDGLGLATTDHELPFHCSMRVRSPKPVSAVAPAATQNDALLQLTVFR